MQRRPSDAHRSSAPRGDLRDHLRCEQRREQTQVRDHHPERHVRTAFDEEGCQEGEGNHARSFLFFAVLLVVAAHHKPEDERGQDGVSVRNVGKHDENEEAEEDELDLGFDHAVAVRPKNEGAIRGSTTINAIETARKAGTRGRRLRAHVGDGERARRHMTHAAARAPGRRPLTPSPLRRKEEAMHVRVNTVRGATNPDNGATYLHEQVLPSATLRCAGPQLWSVAGADSATSAVAAQLPRSLSASSEREPGSGV
jgi:hypothetical protein